ncbi:hypothetical protein O1611_g9416 [Lasiodiplodia mahajangana]|uniref:Uncharacterized protein n=1 Tax=Lasiodiplodia mahajangana TaxID=1108764 RepID=A0ACC2J9Z3_9PEZI|nr:hypothetical protein O1611_g9416 [Lasiodiplodia mahajangana]
MDKIKDNSNHPPTQRPFRSRRRSRASKKEAEEEEDEQLDHLSQLVAQGWKREDSLMANKVFLCGPLIVQGRLYATDKLCMRGDFLVTGKLECEGTLTLHGSIACREKPIIVKNLVVLNQGGITGNVVVTAGAFIKGKCTINGKLTVTGTVRISGTLRCKDLNLTGKAEGFGYKPEFIVEGNSVINGKDTLCDKLARLLREHEASSQNQGASLPSDGMA